MIDDKKRNGSVYITVKNSLYHVKIEYNEGNIAQDILNEVCKHYEVNPESHILCYIRGKNHIEYLYPDSFMFFENDKKFTIIDMKIFKNG